MGREDLPIYLSGVRVLRMWGVGDRDVCRLVQGRSMHGLRDRLDCRGLAPFCEDECLCVCICVGISGIRLRFVDGNSAILAR